MQHLLGSLSFLSNFPLVRGGSSVSPKLSNLSGLLSGMTKCTIWHMAKRINVNSGHILLLSLQNI